MGLRKKLLLSSFICCLVLLCGCRGSGYDVILDPSPGTDAEADGGASSAWDELSELSVWEDERISPRFLEPDRARPAPGLTLRDPGGGRMQKAFQSEDVITVVVFWSLDSWVTVSALLHADYLMQRYSGYDVQAFGVAENPDTYRRAPELIDHYNLELDNYFDDFNALDRLSRAAGRPDIGKALPCFFLIDHKGRVRLSKLGFSPSAVSDDLRGTASMEVLENAPPGKRIEDYLRRLIMERDRSL